MKKVLLIVLALALVLGVAVAAGLLPTTYDPGNQKATTYDPGNQENFLDAFDIPTYSRGFRGAVFQPAAKAPSFVLTDQDGREVRMSDLRGKAVVLTFLYTACLDVCPAIGGKFGSLQDQFHSELDAKVEFLAISVDPDRDTAERIKEFNKKFTVDLTYLNGDQETLEPLWKTFGVAVQQVMANGTAIANVQHHDDEAPHPPALDYFVGHTAVVYLIDPEGMMRAVHLGDVWSPADLLYDIRLLLA